MKKLVIATLIINFLILICNYTYAQYPIIEIEWDKTYGKNNDLNYVSTVQTDANDYVTLGYATGEFEINRKNIGIIKVNKKGNQLLNKSWSEGYCKRDLSEWISATSITKTYDNGYVFTVNKTGMHSFPISFKLIKIDENGNIKWKKKYTGKANSIIQTSNGGFVIAGTSIIRTNNKGNKIWSKTYRESSWEDQANCIIQTADWGFVIVGQIERDGYLDLRILKLDAKGNEIWNKTFIGIDENIAKSTNVAKSIIQTSDGGYAIAGYISSSSTTGQWRRNLWILKLDKNGDKIWDKILDKTANTHYVYYYIIQTSDNCYVIANTHLVIKLDSNGNKIWNKSFRLNLHFVAEKDENNYVVIGSIGSNNEKQLRIIKFKQITISEIVNSKINQWQKQSEFENDIDYNKRIRNQKVAKTVEFTNFVIDSIKQVIVNDGINCWAISDYNANNGTFQINIGQLGDIILPVETEYAQNFKEHFRRIEIKNIELFISNNTLKLASADFYNPNNKKTHNYNNENIIPDISPNIIDTVAPIIKIISPIVERGGAFKPINNLTSKITIIGKVSDISGVSEVYVEDKKAKLDTTGKFESEVMLKVGTNKIKIKATDIKNNSVTEIYYIERVYENVVIPVVPIEPVIPEDDKYYALIIGVSDYTDPKIPDLDNEPTNDAQELYNVLTQQYTFEIQNVTLLKNPTRKNILRSLLDFNKKISYQDNFLIFYAGHGDYDEENNIGYWIPADAEYGFPDSYIYNSVLADEIKKIHSKHTLLIADACFSGSIFRTRTLPTNAETVYQEKYKHKSRNAMTSGTLKTVPNESVFFKYLINTLKDNTQKYLSASELFQKIEKPVTNNNLKKNIPQFGDIQNVGDEGGDFIFIRKD